MEVDCTSTDSSLGRETRRANSRRLRVLLPEKIINGEASVANKCRIQVMGGRQPYQSPSRKEMRDWGESGKGPGRDATLSAARGNNLISQC